ncbi:MAG: ribbon-helix-helix domain-containing protein [Candidatus Amesbacteria bacterium]|nr:ribbon-helix-helix domain-containing protein [Candidatus Amesbacteria bacterium]
MATLTISLPTQFITQINTEVKAQGATRSEFFRALLRKYFFKEIKFEPFIPRPLDEIKEGMLETGKYNKKFVNSVIKGLSRSSYYANKSA